MQKKFLIGTAGALFLVVALWGCGGGGGGGGGGGAFVESPGVVSLPAGHGVAAGEIRVAAGASAEHGNVVVMCTGVAECVMTVMAGETAYYDRTGGVPTVEPRYDPWGPLGHGLRRAITVPAGLSRKHGNMVVSCPSAEGACVVRVSADGTAEYAATGAKPTFTFVHPTQEMRNPTAEDLLDHWNEPEQLRTALGLSPVDPATAADRTNVLTNLIRTTGGDPAETGTKLRNVRPEDIEIIGERDGITYGLWKGGPAGTLNIEFDWRFAADLDATVRARMERAGKVWSWRFLDDFGMHTLNKGREIRFHDVLWAELDEDVSTNGLRIFVVDKRSGGSSTGAARGPRKRTEDDYEPPFGGILLSSRAHESTHTMVHEIGHVLGISSGVFPSKTRYTNTTDYTFEGPAAMRANGGAPVPFQWVNQDNRIVPPHSPGAEVDWGHLGVCTSIMAYCSDPREVFLPSELDFAFLDDIGYEILDAHTASEPELYGYGAWGQYSAWGVGVERTIDYQGGRIVEAADTLRASADAFGVGPGTTFANSHVDLTETVIWSGSLIGVDLGQAMLPLVLGAAYLQVDLSSLQGTASFHDLTVHVDGASSAFRAPHLDYAIGVTGNAFSDADGRVLGGFYGPGHEEMAGVVYDDAPLVNLIAGFGGLR